jgi:hypothetical protein
MRRTVEDLKVLAPDITERLKALQGQVVAIQRNAADATIPEPVSDGRLMMRTGSRSGSHGAMLAINSKA